MVLVSLTPSSVYLTYLYLITGYTTYTLLINIFHISALSLMNENMITWSIL
jgi:hypothetical protein